jgi:polysaccharide export outer membrane protein/exopolysaccharide production protein ExoF
MNKKETMVGGRTRLACFLPSKMLAMVGVLFLALVPMVPEQALAQSGTDEYRLGPLDKIRLKVFEWRPSRDEIFEWEALNDEYTVTAAGKVSLPLVGEIAASGRAPGELGLAIEAQLKDRLGLAASPAISVEVVQFRPFYVAGQVERPGEYPFRPGLTVLKALSIAGGLQKPTELGLSRLISGLGDLELLTLDTNSLMARRARLEAELKDTDQIQFPRSLTDRQNIASIAVILQQEQHIFASRREALRTQIAALKQLKSYLEKEVVSLTAQVESEDKQMSLLKEELKGVNTLASKGLVSTPRQLGLERSLAQMEGDRLRRQSELMRARQEISKTDIAILELQNKRTNEVALELRLTQAALEQAGKKWETSQRLVEEATGLAHLRGAEVIYTIVRQSGGQPVEIAATETTAVEPGDTVKVRAPGLIGPNPAAPVASAGTDRSAGSAVAGKITTADQPR